MKTLLFLIDLFSELHTFVQSSYVQGKTIIEQNEIFIMNQPTHTPSHKLVNIYA